MTSIRRYQLACAVLAASTVAALAWPRATAPAPGRAARPAIKGRAAAQDLRRPLRVSAAAVGLSERELIEKLLAARTLQEVQIYADKLGAVGTDDGVDALASLADDPRMAVPEAAIAAIGKIGSERAVATLAELTDDARPRIRGAALTALADAGGGAAADILLAVAADRGDPLRATAVYALGTLGGDTAADALARIATTSDIDTAQAAVYALTQIPSDHAQRLLAAMIDSGDARIRTQALANLRPVDAATVAKVVALLGSGDPGVVSSAVAAGVVVTQVL